jgi:hypothetical protein
MQVSLDGSFSNSLNLLLETKLLLKLNSKVLIFLKWEQKVIQVLKWIKTLKLPFQGSLANHYFYIFKALRRNPGRFFFKNTYQLNLTFTI